MKEKWLTKAPAIEEVVGESKDERTNSRNSTVLIIPTCRTDGMLRTHLERLTKQTTKKFDIIIVYEPDNEFAAKPNGTSVLHIRRKENSGSAGGFYTGELVALDEGYEKIILSDDDCLPESEVLIERMAAALDKEDVVMPKVTYLPIERITGGSLHMYAGMRKEVLKKSGLTFYPLYVGGEDYDLATRISKSIKDTNEIEAVVSHQRVAPFILFPKARMYYYTRGLLLQLFLSGSFTKTAFKLFLDLSHALVLALVGNGDGARVYKNAILDAVAMRFFRIPIESNELIVSKANMNEPVDLELDLGQSETRANDIFEFAVLYTKDYGMGTGILAKRAGYALNYFFEAYKYLNKKIRIKDWYSFIDLPVLLLSKTTYIEHKRNGYRVSGERNLLLILVDLVAFAMMVPLMAIGALILTSIGFINMKAKNIKSRGYGVGSVV